AVLAREKTPEANVQPIAFWENLWPGAASSGVTATQAIFREYIRRAPDYITALEDIDFRCRPACSKLGPYAIYDPQFASFTAWRSIAGGNYHSMQVTLRKSLIAISNST
ncbi:MAG: hypothetical protein WKF37_03865, partial [Bryobacteraceae bacterium]